MDGLWICVLDGGEAEITEIRFGDGEVEEEILLKGQKGQQAWRFK